MTNIQKKLINIANGIKVNKNPNIKIQNHNQASYKKILYKKLI